MWGKRKQRGGDGASLRVGSWEVVDGRVKDDRWKTNTNKKVEILPVRSRTASR